MLRRGKGGHYNEKAARGRLFWDWIPAFAGMIPLR